MKTKEELAEEFFEKLRQENTKDSMATCIKKAFIAGFDAGEENYEAPKIEFVSYDGSYPNLCSGTLVLKINGEEVVFPKYCLCSGGSCGFSSDFSEENITSGPWSIDLSEIPQQYKKYRAEILEVINDNIPWGCCGGCL